MAQLLNAASKESTALFRIEKNVLIGREKSAYRQCKNVGEIVLERLRNEPEFVAEVLAETGEESTFGRIRKRSVKCAIWLRKQGVRPGDVIGICTDNNLDTCVLVFATLYVGAVISGWDHELSTTSASSFLSLMSPRLIFANASTAANLALAAAAAAGDLRVKIATIGNCEGFESLTEILGSVDDAAIEEFVCTGVARPEEEVAAICWSSGSTGLPKGTLLSHRSLLNCGTPTEDVRIADEVSMWTPTIRWHFGLALIFEAVLSRSKKIIVPDTDDDTLLLETIEKYEVTYFGCDPCIPIRWAKSGLLEKHRVPSLRKIVVSGARFNAEKQRAVARALPDHAQILQCYGLTDAGGLCISQATNSKPGSCGFVCEGFQLKLVDGETGDGLGPNKTGEIWLKSSSVMNGYYRNPEETKKVLDSEGWLHTNDMAYYDDDGEIFLVDRISEFINYRAIKLSPAEIESVLENHPSVLKAAVVPVPHQIDEEHPMAFIVKVPGKEVTEEELINLVAETLPWYCNLQGGIEFMAELPRTSTGKIAKKKLKEIAALNNAQHSSAPCSLVSTSSLDAR